MEDVVVLERVAEERADGYEQGQPADSAAAASPSRVTAAMDSLDFSQRQKFLRLVIEEVRVTGWDVEIRLRTPLEEARARVAPTLNGIGLGFGARTDEGLPALLAGRRVFRLIEDGR